MLYSLYNRRINNIKEDLEREWIKILSRASMDLVEEVISDFVVYCEFCNIDLEDYEIVALPDVYKGNRVINTKTQEIGEVYEILDPRHILVKNIINKRSTNFVSNMYKWNTVDVFVLDNTEA